MVGTFPQPLAMSVVADAIDLVVVFVFSLLHT